MNTKNRRSIRLQGYDYSQAGAYYVTICTQDRLCLFGNVINGEMVLNDRGRMVDHWLREVENKFKRIEIPEYVIMPNHIHVIVVNLGVGVDLHVDPNNKHVDPNNEHDLTIGTRTSIVGAHTGAPLRMSEMWLFRFGCGFGRRDVACNVSTLGNTMPLAYMYVIFQSV